MVIYSTGMGTAWGDTCIKSMMTKILKPGTLDVYDIWFCLQALPFPHDGVIKWEHFPRYGPFVRGIHRSPPVDSPHKGQWCGALVFSLICTWINGWTNNRGAGDMRRHDAHYDVPVMKRFVNSLRPSDAYIGSGGSLTAGCQAYCLLDLWKQISQIFFLFFWSEYHNFYQRKCFCKYRLENVEYFVSDSMCQKANVKRLQSYSLRPSDAYMRQ